VKMPSFLTFALVAPLASFGGVAVGERRASHDRPAKSAILGLVAGALGIERNDRDAHAALDRELFYAVRTEDIGRSPRRLMMDYHTVQAPPRGRNQRFATRREELADKQNLGTILSYREYRGDCSFSIALWPRILTTRFSLEEITQALRNPIFAPYAGRKACPLILPMQPLIVEAVGIREAFAQRDAACEKQRAFLECHGLLATPHWLALDADAAQTIPGRRERKRDQVLDRSRWQFVLRDEILCPWHGDAG
jgi:CRISPR system Cascade subunit CasD